MRSEPASLTTGIRRPDFSLLARRTYLDSCSLGALSHHSHEAMRSYGQQCDEWGAAAWDGSGGFLEMLDALRGRVAALIGAHDHEIGLAPNVSVALASLSSAVLSPGSRVVSTDLDFPTLVLGLRALARSGVDIEVVASPDRRHIPLESMTAALDTPAALLATSRVFYGSGVVQDVAELSRIARERGCLTLIDDYQGTGQLPVDVHELGVDMMVGGFLKWLCGGSAGAFFYVREDLLDRLTPSVAGWFGVADQLDFTVAELTWRDSARKFELGTPSMVSVGLANAGLALIDDIGLSAIRSHNTALTGYLAAAATRAGFPPRLTTPPHDHSALMLLDVGGETSLDELVRRLRRQHGVVVDARNGALRVSPHFYNHRSDIDELVGALTACRRDG